MAVIQNFIFLVIVFGVFVYLIEYCYRQRQKTRDPQQRRIYVGSRVRPSLGQAAPSIYVSPANLTPPPKYEAMAPPSYEEVVGIHYPNYQPPSMSQTIAAQPITQPIVAAVAQQNSQTNDTTSQTTSRTDVQAATTSTVTVTIPPTTSVSQ